MHPALRAVVAPRPTDGAAWMQARWKQAAQWLQLQCLHVLPINTQHPVSSSFCELFVFCVIERIKEHASSSLTMTGQPTVDPPFDRRRIGAEQNGGPFKLPPEQLLTGTRGCSRACVQPPDVPPRTNFVFTSLDDHARPSLKPVGSNVASALGSLGWPPKTLAPASRRDLKGSDSQPLRTVHDFFMCERISHAFGTAQQPASVLFRGGRGWTCGD